MGVLTEIYVDPSINANSGTGTIGDAFGDLQYALNTATRDATNGNRINIKAGTAEVLTGSISLTTFGAPGNGKPLVFEGYTSAAGDGGVGAINGNNGNFTIWAGSWDYTSFKFLELTNTGTATIITMRDYGSLINCIVHLANANGVVMTCLDGGTIAIGNHVYDVSGYGIYPTAKASSVQYNYLANGGTYSFSTAIYNQSRYCVINGNIISISGATIGIGQDQYYSCVQHNSILSSSGTGKGIDLYAYYGFGGICSDNLIEGFSGVGGKGINADADVVNLVNNAVYNCTTAYSIGDQVIHDGDGNETLGATPFAKSGSDTFANRAVYFAPVAAVQGTAYPTAFRLDKGAVQHADPAGGGGRPEFRGSNL